ncbi:MAG: hypothetical protein NTX03_02685 [Bacteroidetes bacterium]|nr:hypothetical protein [Bacteroidota bacterium]
MLVEGTCYGQSIDNLDDKNGYKDLRFGMPKYLLNDKISNCTENGNCLLFGTEYRKIRNVYIDEVYLKFTDDKLTAIFLTVTGEENVNRLLNIYNKTYGTTTNSNLDKLIMYWEGSAVILSYDIDVDQNGNVKALASIASKNLLKKNSEIEIQKNKDDL